jgi:hypothetical protein
LLSLSRKLPIFAIRLWHFCGSVVGECTALAGLKKHLVSWFIFHMTSLCWILHYPEYAELTSSVSCEARENGERFASSLSRVLIARVSRVGSWSAGHFWREDQGGRTTSLDSYQGTEGSPRRAMLPVTAEDATRWCDEIRFVDMTFPAGMHSVTGFHRKISLPIACRDHTAKPGMR